MADRSGCPSSFKKWSAYVTSGNSIIYQASFPFYRFQTLRDLIANHIGRLIFNAVARSFGSGSANITPCFVDDRSST